MLSKVFAPLFVSFVAGGAADKPIKVNIYYETDCPFSKNFVASELGPMLSDPDCVQTQTDFNWVPYGNADVADTGNPEGCQHGEDECFGNRLHLCAKREFGADGDGLTQWVTCVMTNLVPDGKQSHDETTFRPCDDGKAQAILDCANGDESLQMLTAAGAETKGASIQQAPWAVLEAAPGYNLQGSLVQSICSQMQEQNLGQPQCCAAALVPQRRLLV